MQRNIVIVSGAPRVSLVPVFSLIETLTGFPVLNGRLSMKRALPIWISSSEYDNNSGGLALLIILGNGGPLLFLSLSCATLWPVPVIYTRCSLPVVNPYEVPFSRRSTFVWAPPSFSVLGSPILPILLPVHTSAPREVNTRSSSPTGSSNQWKRMPTLGTSKKKGEGLCHHVQEALGAK